MLLLAIGFVTLTGCGSGTRVTRVEPGIVTDLSGRWNDTDSKMVAETMVKEALGSVWLQEYGKTHDWRRAFGRVPHAQSSSLTNNPK